MKFKFCGDLDCPDWLLLEIMNLSKLSTVKVKVLSLYCVKIFLENNQMDLSKIQQHISNNDISDSKSVIAALHFMMIQAAKYDTNPLTLSEEIQQLGLPKEHSNQIVKCYEDNFQNIIEVLKKQFIRNSRIIHPIKWTIPTPIENRVSRIALSDAETIPLDPVISFDLNYEKVDSTKQVKLTFSMNYMNFLCLKTEIARLLERMNNVMVLK